MKPTTEVQAEVTALPKRSEVPVKLTWDLSVVYADEAAWEADFQRVEAMIAPFSEAQNTLGQAPANLLRCLQRRDEVSRQYSQLRAYASLRRSEDNANAEAQARADRATMLGTRLAAALAFIEPEILSIPSDQLREFVAQEPELRLYEYYLETLERRRPHVCSAEVEDVLAQVSEAMFGSGKVFTLFNNADLKFPAVRDENEVETELTHGRYLKFLENRSRRVREDAFRTMHGEYSKWRNTLAATISGAVKAHVAEARVRHYDSALDAALSPDDIPVAVYHNLVAAVRERLPVLHRYLRLRKKMLGLPDLQMWDLYVPMVPAVDRPVSYEAAQRSVLDSSQPLGREYIAAMSHGFATRWVDVLENEGKTSGAFSDGAYSTPPYILMNWQDRIDSLFTLAHEFGHSMHSFFTRRAQPFVYSDYTIFVAEVASTLSEALLTHHLLENARRDGDRALQLYLLNYQAERFRTTLYRQTMFAEFELKIHETVERGAALTAESMSAAYKSLNDDYYGAEVMVDDCVAIEWARIPHFYYGYYVYQYATGISAAAALAQQILHEGQPAVDRYLSFLSGGSSDTS
ncbi:MAG TPA: oligoendopeptidase F, partial [Abditibacteriaceae bacterium]|nr:oligoendopeptidase F [Abditibacteriaceae bacterium]